MSDYADRVAALLALRPNLRPRKAVLVVLQAAAMACAIGVAWAWTAADYDNALLYRGGFFALGTGVACIIAAAVLWLAG